MCLENARSGPGFGKRLRNSAEGALARVQDGDKMPRGRVRYIVGDKYGSGFRGTCLPPLTSQRSKPCQ